MGRGLGRERVLSSQHILPIANPVHSLCTQTMLIHFGPPLCPPPVERSSSFTLSRENKCVGSCQGEGQLPFGVESEKESIALTTSEITLTQFLF